MAKRTTHPGHLAKYTENAHAKQNRALRQENNLLKQQIQQMELDSKVQASEGKLKEIETKQTVAKAQPFVDQQGKGRKTTAKKK